MSINLREEMAKSQQQQRVEDKNEQGFTGNPKTLFVNITELNEDKDTGLVHAKGFDISQPDDKQVIFDFTVMQNNDFKKQIDGIQSIKNPGTYFKEPIVPNSNTSTVVLKHAQQNNEGLVQAWSASSISDQMEMTISPCTISINSNKGNGKLTVYSPAKALTANGDDVTGFVNKFKQTLDVDDHQPTNVRAGALVRFIPEDENSPSPYTSFKQQFAEELVEQPDGSQKLENLPLRTADEYISAIDEMRKSSNSTVARMGSNSFAALQKYIEWAQNPDIKGYFEIIPTKDFPISSQFINGLISKTAEQSDADIAANIKVGFSDRGKRFQNQFNIYKDVTNQEQPRRRQVVSVMTNVVIGRIHDMPDRAYISDLEPSYRYTKGQLPHELNTESTKFPFRNVSQSNKQDIEYLESDGQKKYPKHQHAIAVKNGELSPPLNNVQQAPKPEAPKTEAPKTEAPKTEAPKTEAPKPESPKTEAPKTEAPKTEAPKTEAPKTEAPKTESPKTEAPKTESPKTEAQEPDWVNAPETEAEIMSEINESSGASFDDFSNDFDDDIFNQLSHDALFGNDNDEDDELAEEFNQSFKMN